MDTMITTKKSNEDHQLQQQQQQLSLVTPITRARWLIPLAILTSLPSLATASSLFSSGPAKQPATTHPTLDLIEATVVTTASQDFSSDHHAFVIASIWQSQRLSDTDQPGPYLACGSYTRGSEARSKLEGAFSSLSVRTVSHTEAHGVCFVVTASPADAEVLLRDPSTFGLHSAVPFLSTMKLAPGLLNIPVYEVLDDSNESAVLQITHGENMKLGSVRGLNIGLSPGVALSERDARTLADGWRTELMSESLDLWYTSIWSDPDMLDGEGGHLARPGGKLRAREWSRAAELLHGLAALHGTSVGEVCAWDRLIMRPMGESVVTITGMNR